MVWSHIENGDLWSIVRQKINDIGALSDTAPKTTDTPDNSVWNLGTDTTPAPISPQTAKQAQLKVLARATFTVSAGGGITILDSAGIVRILYFEQGGAEYISVEVNPDLVQTAEFVAGFANYSNPTANNDSGAVSVAPASFDVWRILISRNGGAHDSDCDYCSFALLGWDKL